MQVSRAFRAVCQRILTPLASGQARRHLWVGDTGMGKTTANQALIEMALQGNYVDLVLTHDEKDPWQTQYPGGTERIDVNDLKQRPPSGDMDNPRHIVFRGIALSRRRDVGCKPDSLAQVAWEIIQSPSSQQRIRILLNFDELHDALIPNSQIWDGPSIGSAYRKGRSVGISVFAGIQQPQLLPRESFGLAETIGLFRMDGREAKYLLNQKIINEAQAKVIPFLGIGDFILSAKGERTSTGKVVIVNVRNEQPSISGVPENRETDKEMPSDRENQRDERTNPGSDDGSVRRTDSGGQPEQMVDPGE
jgi:hypothetical protein